MSLARPLPLHPPEEILGYRGLEKIFESARSRVFRARRESDGQPVILKLLQEDYLERHEIARYKNQYRILSEAKLSCSPALLAYEKHHNAPLLVAVDCGGESLDALLEAGPLELSRGLDIAAQLAKALVEIHAKQIIHKDLNPSNILFCAASGEVKVIDFGISTRLLREQAQSGNQGVTEGSLPYMSPEQTGRMNRFVDYRTDFYSLGVTLYQIFTGRLPFEADDPLRLIHFHIAKKPVSPRHFNQKIPPLLDELIMKLLSKNPEDRYQSSWGLMADLQKMQKSLGPDGSLLKFPLALQDIPDRFHIPEVLYGRQAEKQKLLAGLERVGEGEREFCLVAGYSGVGKTSLIRVLQKPVAQAGGYYVSGKFDPFRRHTPYSAIVDAFRELLRQFLGESEQALGLWRSIIGRALGPNGQLIAAVIPEVELIVGPQPPLPQLGPSESDKRFKMVFSNFVRCFAEAEHCLALHLDDLQWADAASLTFIQQLLSDARLKHFYLIASYRDNEVDRHHPLLLLVDELRQVPGLRLETIELASLGQVEVRQMVADTLYASPERARPLADLLIDKTGGNPFFTEEFLRTLYADGLLFFHPEKGQWDWDLEKIRAENMSDNVVELMSGRIQRLSPAGQHLIQLAACIGAVFELTTLASVAGIELEAAALLLREAMSQGLIVPIGEGYRLVELDIPISQIGLSIPYKFTHDRIQQAASDLIDTGSRQKVRYQVGRSLLKAYQGSRRDEQIFTIVNHLNSSLALLASEEERLELLGLNLNAARKAKSSAAYQAALEYLKTALRLVDERDWNAAHSLLLALYREAAEVAFLAQAYELMDSYIAVVLRRGKDLLERVPAYATQVHAAIAKDEMAAAIRIGTKVLAELGVSLPKNPGWLRIAGSVLGTRWALRGKSVEQLLALPAMQDPLQLARMQFLYAMAQVIFYFFPRQVPIITGQLVRTTLKHGNTPSSALAYNTFGMIMAAMLGDVKFGYKLGELGIKLYEKLGAKEIEAATLVCFNMFIRPWKDHVRSTLKPLLLAHQAGLDAGDFEFAAHAVLGYCNRSFFSGAELKGLEADIQKFAQVSLQLDQRSDAGQLRLLRQATLQFIEASAEPWILKGEGFDEGLELPRYEKAQDAAAIFNSYFFKTMLATIFDQPSQAVSYARIAEPYFKVVMGTLSGAVFYFYYGLALLQVRGSSRREEWERRRKIASILRKMRKWAARAPMNFQHKYDLLRAEQLAGAGKPYAAQQAYDAAIAGAKNQQYLQEEALANELAAKFHEAHGRHTAAYAYMRRARYNYERWGAAAKARAMEERYPQMLSAASQDRSGHSSLATMSSSTIDITTLKRALLAIAEENVHSRMLEKIISSSIEFAGAQRGALLLRKEGEFFIEAEGSVDQEKPTILQAIALEHSHHLSKMVINFVRRAQKGLVIDNASQPQEQLPGLHREPYVQKGKIKSILCIPITVGIGSEAELVGLLYLENNRANATFTPERIETLEIICLAAAGRLELSVKAATDGLTGLFNHDYFQSMLGQEMLQAQRQLRNLSLIMVDIDHFKSFNDRWGHQIGDLVLKRVAQAVRDTCRKSDVVARYGGEEMAVILPETSPDMASLVAERIRKAVEALEIQHEKALLKVTISLGVASISEEVKDKDLLIEKADEALYSSKRGGRNRVSFA